MNQATEWAVKIKVLWQNVKQYKLHKYDRLNKSVKVLEQAGVEQCQ